MKKYLIHLIAIAVLLVPTSSALAFPSFPMAFWGSITVDGNPAPVGTVVKAYYGSSLVGQVTVDSSGIYGYTDSTKQKLLINSGTSTITFTITSPSINSGNETGGQQAVTYPAFQSGATVNDNLTFTTQSTQTVVVTTGGGGGGGGGGGSSPVSTATTTSSVIGKKGDANNDGKVDLLDFNILMINWGKTGSAISGDLNNDGKVDLLDFNILMINWGVIKNI